MDTYTPAELIRFLEAAGESANIDAKGPMLWDNGEASAGLAKDILAFANSRDGGVIVIGKEEAAPGKFVLTGLTSDQADSFETTRVATWMNNRCAPPVNVICYRIAHDGREFIVLTVAEFDDVPVICTKQFELTAKPSKVLLRAGTIYVRTANAESAPLSSIEDVRALIGLATTKRGDELLSMFQAMMKGRSLLEARSAEDLFQSERAEVFTSLDAELDGHTEKGAWTLICHPVGHEEDRWENKRLNQIVDSSVVRIRRSFPPGTQGMHVREWGICSQFFEDAFGLTRTGYFMAIRLFRENSLPFKNPWQPNPDVPAGAWLDFKHNLGILIEFFAFLSRFAHNFDVGEELTIEILAEPLAGRQLVSMDSNINLDPTEPCRAFRYRQRKTVSVENLRAGWEELCVQALSGFFELFNGPTISDETFRKWIENFKERRVD